MTYETLLKRAWFWRDDFDEVSRSELGSKRVRDFDLVWKLRDIEQDRRISARQGGA